MNINSMSPWTPMSLNDMCSLVMGTPPSGGLQPSNPFGSFVSLLGIFSLLEQVFGDVAGQATIGQGGRFQDAQLDEQGKASFGGLTASGDSLTDLAGNVISLHGARQFLVHENGHDVLGNRSHPGENFRSLTVGQDLHGDPGAAAEIWVRNGVVVNAPAPRAA